MTATTSKDLLLAVGLFALSAKLWLSLNDRRLRRDDDELRRRRRKDDCDGGPNHRGSAAGPSGRSTKSSPDSDGLSDDDDDDEEVKTTGRKLSRDLRMSLMNKITFHDAVLTRETSPDFHPKNSNWSHFENYTPSFSPLPVQMKTTSSISSDGRSEEGDSNKDEEDFLWSEPPPRAPSLDDEASSHYADGALHTLRRGYSRKYSSTAGEDILHFNAGCLPSKLIMVRHGQSEGNVDESAYATKPDNALHLTKLGWEMARMAGRALREQLPRDETVHFIVSPYARTVETFHGIVSAWCDPEDEKLFGNVKNRSRRLRMWYTRLMEMGLTWHEDPRIREQDFGNYQDPQVIKKAKSERHKFGSFYYRFPHGESASDVFDRVSTFLDSLWRSFESGRAQNYVLVAHGISIRVFLTRYFRYSIDQFHMLANPKNCEMVMLAHDGQGRLKLDGRCELELSEVEADDEATMDREAGGEGGGGKGMKSEDAINGRDKTKLPKAATTTTVVTGYKRHPRLRTLPPQYICPRTVRMCYSDMQ